MKNSRKTASSVYFALDWRMQLRPTRMHVPTQPLHVERSTPVTLRFTRWRGPGRAVPLALAAALIALPAAANEARPAAKAKTGQVSLRQAATREASRTSLTPVKASRRADQSGTSQQSPGFFRTGPGAIALVVMAVGTGYAIYSASHDKITSPAKK
jgi:hypothetical protein